MQKSFIILFSCIIILVSGCSLFGEIPWGKSRVSFVLPEIAGTDSPNELIYIDLNSDNPVYIMYLWKMDTMKLIWIKMEPIF